MTDPMYEFLFRSLEENWKHARLSEDKRATIANLVILIASAIQIALAVVGLSIKALPLTIMLIILATYGAFSTAKLYERAQYHIQRARKLRAQLDALCSNAHVQQLQGEAEEEHKKRYPRLMDIRLNNIWLALYGLIAALGVIYTVICLMR